jgi:hypothetical protein
MLLTCIPYVTFHGSTAVFPSLNLQASEAVVSTVLSLSIMACMAVSVRFGLVATTVAGAVIPLALMPMPILAIRRKGHLAVGDILRPQTLPLIAAAVIGAVTLTRLYIAPYLPEAAALPLLIAGGAILYPILIIALVPRPPIEFLRRFC